MTSQNTTGAPARNPGDNPLIRYVPATELNGHPLRGWCQEYEIWTQDRTRLPWVMRGWVTGPDAWTALPVNPDAGRDRWTEPLPTRDAAARTMLAARPDNAGAQRPDAPDAAAHTAAEPGAPTWRPSRRSWVRSAGSAVGPSPAASPGAAPVRAAAASPTPPSPTAARPTGPATR